MIRLQYLLSLSSFCPRHTLGGSLFHTFLVELPLSGTDTRERHSRSLIHVEAVVVRRHCRGL